MEVFLVDGTYELFRHYYAVPSARDKQGREVGAVRGVLASVLGMIKGGATHIAVATDHVIESFRNQLWPGYKTSAGIEPDLLALRLSLRPNDLICIDEHPAVLVHPQSFGDRDFVAFVEMVRLDHTGFVFPPTERKVAALNPTTTPHRVASTAAAATYGSRSH